MRPTRGRGHGPAQPIRMRYPCRSGPCPRWRNWPAYRPDRGEAPLLRELACRAHNAPALSAAGWPADNLFQVMRPTMGRGHGPAQPIRMRYPCRSGPCPRWRNRPACRPDRGEAPLLRELACRGITRQRYPPRDGRRITCSRLCALRWVEDMGRPSSSECDVPVGAGHARDGGTGRPAGRIAEKLRSYEVAGRVREQARSYRPAPARSS